MITLVFADGRSRCVNATTWSELRVRFPGETRGCRPAPRRWRDGATVRLARRPRRRRRRPPRAALAAACAALGAARALAEGVCAALDAAAAVAAPPPRAAARRRAGGETDGSSFTTFEYRGGARPSSEVPGERPHSSNFGAPPGGGGDSLGRPPGGGGDNFGRPVY